MVHFIILYYLISKAYFDSNGRKKLKKDVSGGRNQGKHILSMN
jgi:hypothetical protein